MLFQDLYTQGAYLTSHPTWHVEEAPWKTYYALRLMARNHLAPRAICEVGCGAGEILRLLQRRLDTSCQFYGYEISPQAFAMARKRANSRLTFKLGDIRDDPGRRFDLILVMDVLEHMENYFDLLRAIQPMSQYTIFHIPLDISVRSVLSGELAAYRQTHGHIHYFTRELALRTLSDAGYEVLDWLYTKEGEFTWRAEAPAWGDVMRKPATLPTAMLKQGKHAAKKLLVRAIGDDWSERIFGEWRLMALAR
jgi:SAM-dependent methyltransferase